jgi:hypothetical protein
MMYMCKRFMICCTLLGSLASGCGDSGDGDKPSNGAAGSTASGSGGSGTGGSGTSGTSASGQGGGGGTMAGASGSAGSQEQTPPPEMPRELGPPDGIYCESAFDPPPETCSAGSRCCPNDVGGEHEQVCIADGGKCPPCDAVTCGQLLCDGPEDCSAGQFCCYANQGSCKSNPEDCTGFQNSYWMVVECQARCVGDQGDPEHGIVVCKDDRDCPGRYVRGRCQPLDTGQLPYGLKVCSGG